MTMPTTDNRIAALLPLLMMGGLACASPLADDEEVAGPQSALAGREGKLEFAVDTPWRIEPVGDGEGGKDWGAIPIQISIHDVDLVGKDGNYRAVNEFLELVVIEHAPGGTLVRRHYSLNSLAVIELSDGHWGYRPPDHPTCGTAPSPGGCPEVRPTHQLCEPWRGEDCSSLGNLSSTSEWHATAFYRPVTRTPGARVHLEFQVRLAGYGNDELTLENEAWVVLAADPMPRFPGGWLYGDLHYHSQGTDNEGESGYSWIGVAHAMGAMGMDFVFATEHASNSEQIVDVDVGLDISPEDRRGLRDMSPERFRFGLERLHNPIDGVNTAVLRRPHDGLPQNVRLRSVVPQVYLGGEVDTIPEIPRGSMYGYGYGNGRGYTPDEGVETAEGTMLLRDPQGFLGEGFSRQHLVYMPRSASDSEAFIASNTGPHGGGGRRLRELLPEIQRHGYAFLAHPLAGGSDPGGLLDPGPALAPYHERQLVEAFASPAILGLQLWNEDHRLNTDVGHGDSENTGYFDIDPTDGRFDSPAGDCSYSFEPYTQECTLGLTAFWGQEDGLWESSRTATFGTWERLRAEHLFLPGFQPAADAGSLYGALHHGTYTWDEMLRWGLDEDRVASLGWVPEGEPRRILMAGGSDAHGDFNYRRSGYMIGATGISDTAIGKPRNLVFVGAPRPERPIREALPDVPAELAPERSPVGTTRPTHPGTATTRTSSSRVASLATRSTTRHRRAEGTSASRVSSMSARRATMSRRDAESAETEAAATRERATLVDPPDRVALPPTPRRRYSQTQVVDSLRAGQFSVTDGPALRIVIDKNGNGIIDDDDVPMGGMFNLYQGDRIPVLVEWRSTPEFGPVERVDFYVGAVSGSDGRTYAPQGHGMRDGVDPQSQPLYERIEYDAGRQTMMRDNYFLDPTGQLRINTGYLDDLTRGYHGVHAFSLDPEAFHSGQRHDETSYYLRAFAKTVPGNRLACLAADREDFHRRGQCIERIAYTNPIWAMRRPRESCGIDPLALDRDGDGVANACDGCFGPSESCVAPPSVPTPDSEWALSTGGPAIDDAQAVVNDDAGNIYAAGIFHDTTRLGGRTLVSDGGADGWVVKLSPTGFIQWVQHIRGTGNMRIHDIGVDGTGDVTVTGWFSGQIDVDGERYDAYHDDIFIARFYGAGPGDDPPMRWVRTITGSGRDVGTSMVVKPDGEIGLVGHFSGWLDFPALPGDAANSRLTAFGSTDCFFSRWNGVTGRLIQRKPIRGSGSCYAEGVAFDSADNIVVAGRFDGELAHDPSRPERFRRSAVDYDGFVAKYDLDGYLVWDAHLGGVSDACSNADARITEIGTDAMDHVYVTGHFRRCLALASPSGNALIQPTVGGGFQPFLVELSSLGRHIDLGHKGLGPALTAGNVKIFDVDVRLDGSYAVAGFFDAAAFDPGDGAPMFGTGGRAFYAVYDSDHVLLSAVPIGYGSNTLAMHSSWAPDGHLAVVGRFTGGISPLGVPLASNGSMDAFVMRVMP